MNMLHEHFTVDRFSLCFAHNPNITVVLCWGSFLRKPRRAYGTEMTTDATRIYSECSQLYLYFTFAPITTQTISEASLFGS